MPYLLLLITAAIWGFAFVAQKQGMQSLDPFMFNGIRFALGAAFVRLISLKIRKQVEQSANPVKPDLIRQDKSLSMYVEQSADPAKPLPFPWLLGLVLFIAASLQQLGMVWTTAGNAGFITGLYIIFVPLLGILRHQKTNANLKAAIGLALVGLYLINSNQGIDITLGNAIVLVSAIFWGIHVQMVDKYTHHYETFYLAFAQFAVCAGLSLLIGLGYQLAKQPSFLLHQDFWLNVRQAGLPILYGGLMSVGVAYTLQVYAQKKTKPANAAIILCLEAVFALLGGWWLLSERVSLAMLAGAALLLVAMLLSLLKK